jgi:RNA polymerase sigma-70 factor (ECF subfamily)
MSAIAAARAGDLRAWGSLVDRDLDLGFRTAYLVTRSADLAEETAKAAFARAYRSLRSLPLDAALRPWLMVITVAVARAQLREAGRQRDARLPVRQPSPLRPARPTPHDAAAPRPSPAEGAALHDAFDGLADEDRLVLASRYSFGFRRADAAAFLGIPEAQVDDRLVATAARLRRQAGVSLAVAVDQGHMARPMPGSHASRLLVLGDDQLASLAVAVVMSALPWTPDVTAAVCDRLAREATAYPEHAAPSARSTRRGLADPA